MDKTRMHFMVAVVASVMAGCELTDVDIPEGETQVVVQSVMRPDLNQQYVVAEYTFVGTSVDQTVTGPIPNGAPSRPVLGAVVEVTNLQWRPADDCGPITTFEMSQAPDSLVPGVYFSPTGCPTMEPGDTLALRLETSDGTVVTGTTEIPGASAFLVETSAGLSPIDRGVRVFNRESDTARVRVEATHGRALQVDAFRVLPDDRQFDIPSLFADSTAITIPGEVIDIFEDERFFEPGRYYDLTIGLGDDRYWNFVSSAANPITGRGFINNLEGGVGAFASILVARQRLRVIGDQDNLVETTFHLTGSVDGLPVDVTLEIYLHAKGPGLASSDFSTFVDGTWQNQPVNATADGVWSGQTFTVFDIRFGGPMNGMTTSYVVNASGIGQSQFMADVVEGFTGRVAGQLTGQRVP